MCNIHKIWWDFCDKFSDGDDKDSFKNLVGDEKMEEVEKWAKNYPDVKISKCDDSNHDTSLLVLIPHPTLGISIVYIPQSTYLKDYFFLNSAMQKLLIDNLKSIEIIDLYDNIM